MNRVFFLIVIMLGCQTPTPKPKAQLALSYPIPKYMSFESSCGFEFEYNTLASPQPLSLCGITIDYTSLHAKLYLTYFDLNKFSLDTLFLDFEKRLQMFGKGAVKIDESTYENKDQNVLGACVAIVGNSPSNLHFFGTDTQKHFLTGSLLFEVAPNYDSLAPAIAYVKSDVQKLLETFRWD